MSDNNEIKKTQNEINGVKLPQTPSAQIVKESFQIKNNKKNNDK